MQRVLDSLASRVDPATHPLLTTRDAAGRTARTLLIVDHRRRGPVRQLQHQRHQGGRQLRRRERRPPGGARARRPQGPRLLRPPRLRRALRAGQPVRRSCSSTTRRRSRRAAIEEFIGGAGRPRLSGLQRVQVGHGAAGRRRAAAADSARRRRRRHAATAATARADRLSVRAVAAGDLQRSCCRATSRCRSTARCSSRTPRSTPRR